MACPLRLLAVDIGGGTQDVLLYDEQLEMANCPKLVLPSPTVVVAQRIRQATEAGRHIFLTGNLMGGGPCCEAIQRHLDAGLRVYAEELPAKTIHDNLNRVRQMGVRLVGAKPCGAEAIEMRDIDAAAFRTALGCFDVPMPTRFAVAVLDHGESPTSSNRISRFEQWRRFLQSGGRIESLAYRRIPTRLTRMRAVRRDAPGAMVMDTGAAAVWGALCDPIVEERAEDGVVVVNIGNQHTLAVLLRRRIVYGLFEHHTSCMTASKLADMVARLSAGRLTNEAVFRDYGHGAAMRRTSSRGRFDFVTVLGPKRAVADRLGWYAAVPHGDVMLAGAFGLVAAYKATTT